MRCVTTARALFPYPGKARCHVWGWERSRVDDLKMVSGGRWYGDLKIFLADDIGFRVQPQISLGTCYPVLILTILLPRTLPRSCLSLFDFSPRASTSMSVTYRVELVPPRVITSSPWPEPETLRLAGVAGPNCELILFKVTTVGYDAFVQQYE